MGNTQTTITINKEEKEILLYLLRKDIEVRVKQSYNPLTRDLARLKINRNENIIIKLEDAN